MTENLEQVEGPPESEAMPWEDVDEVAPPEGGYEERATRKGGNKARRGIPSDPKRRAQLAELGNLEFDDWAAAFDWQAPRMKMILKRISPPFYQGVKTSGHLDERLGSPYTLIEIKNRYGGGEYEATICGPHYANDPNPRIMSRKRVQIAGDPMIDGDSLPEETRYSTAPGGKGGRASPVETTATKGLLDIVSGEVEMLRRQSFGDGGRVSNGNIETMKSAYSEAMSVVQASAEARAQAKEVAADERAKLAQEYAERERQERERLAAQVRDMEKEMNERIRSSQGESLGLLSALLPQMTAGANEQVKNIAVQFEAREERLAAQHQNAINNLNTMHQLQLKTQETAFESQIRNLQLMHDNNTTLLKGQIQNLVAEKEHLVRQLDEANRRLEDARKELMTQITTARQPKNSIEQMMEMAQLKDAVEGIFGGNKGDGDELGDGLDDNPMMKNIMKLAGKGLERLPEITSLIRPQQPPPMQPPQAMVPYPPQMMQPPPQRRPAPVPAAPPIPQGPPPVKLKKEDLELAMTIIEATLANPNPPTPEEFAAGAVAKVDNGVLRELARRKPDKVIAQLASAGLLKGQLLEQAGQDYLRAVLAALRPLLLSGE